MLVALIIGITGQDGTYLADFLLSKGYRVIGAVRNPANANMRLSPLQRKKVILVQWDMLDSLMMEKIIYKYRPNEIYNFSAYSSGEGMYVDPVVMSEVNGVAVTRILEAIKNNGEKLKFCQASSSEIFGRPRFSPQTEKTACFPRSPYGAAKLYAHSMIDIYREHYGIFACSAILFNHESPLRGLNFVTRKITNAAAKIKLNLLENIALGDLDARRDWGFAQDYVQAMWLMMQHEYPDDYIVATGITHSVRDVCECAFGYLGLDYRNHIRVDLESCRPREPVELVGDASKARKILSWKPTVDFKSLIFMMVESDLKMHISKIR